MCYNLITIIIRNALEMQNVIEKQKRILFFTVNYGAKHRCFYEIVKQVRSIDKRLGVKLDTACSECWAPTFFQ